MTSIKFTILILSFALCCGKVFSQQSDSTRVYLNQNGNPCNVENAYSFIDFIKNDTLNKYLGKEYYTNGFVKSYGYYQLINSVLLEDGDFVTYYPNGVKESIGAYKFIQTDTTSLKIGRWKHYYSNSNLKEDWLYKIDNTTGSQEKLLINFWDTSGVQKTLKGEGEYTFEKLASIRNDRLKVYCSGSIFEGKKDSIWICVTSDGVEYSSEKYNKGKLTSCKYYYQTEEYVLPDSLNSNVRFPGGESSLYNLLQSRIRYPEPELSDGIQGKVLVGFVVAEDGSRKNIKILKGITPGLNTEAMRVIYSLPDFIPAYKEGKPIRTKFISPIVFRIF